MARRPAAPAGFRRALRGGFLIDVAVIERAVRRQFDELDDVRIEPLASEPTNRCWRIRHAAGSCIAKTPERSGGLTIAPQLEYALMGLAADTGVGPQPLAFDAQTAIVFAQELTDVHSVSTRTLRESGRIRRVGSALRALHGPCAPGELRAFEPLAFAQEYLSAARRQARRSADAAYRQCAQLSARVEHLLAGERICHNDLHAGNVLFGERTWLIDFEYAVRAAPIVDIASFVAWNGLDEPTSLEFARAVLGSEPGFTLDELSAVAGIHRSLGRLWEIARSDNNIASG